MRLAVLFDNFGPYHRARLQAASAGVELVAVQTARQSAEYAWQAADLAAAFRVVTLFDSRTSRQVTTSELSARISSCLAQLKPDVVAIPGWSSKAAFAALGWCLLNRVPVVAMSESTSWDESRVAWKEWLKRQLVGCFSSALVGGRPHVDYLVQLGMPRERIFQGYDAVDNGYFAQGANEARSAECGVRNKYGLPERYFLASARFVEKKNLPRLIEAYAIYREKAEKLPGEVESQTLHGPRKPEKLKAGAPSSDLRPPSSAPWSLVLLGDGALRPELERLISDLGLQSSVSLPGFKQYPELPAYYGCASAFIHASTTEQWGLVVNEAMASGLPVLVSNSCGCSADLVQDGVNGFTFDPYDVEAMAQAMMRISAFQDVSLLAFGAQSARIISEWGPERFASGLKAAAEKALEVGPKRASLVDRLLLNALRHK